MGRIDRQRRSDLWIGNILEGIEMEKSLIEDQGLKCLWRSRHIIGRARPNPFRNPVSAIRNGVGGPGWARTSDPALIKRML